jgi:hypothetical protein
MAAVAGILFTDIMGLPKWYEAGALEYDIPATAQLGVLFPVMGFLELKRLQGFKETGSVSSSRKRWEQICVCLRGAFAAAPRTARGRAIPSRSTAMLCWSRAAVAARAQFEHA